MTDNEINALWTLRDCLPAIQEGDILAQVRSVVRAAEARWRMQNPILEPMYGWALDSLADKYGRRWGSPDEVGWSFEQSAFQDFLTVFAAKIRADKRCTGNQSTCGDPACDAKACEAVGVLTIWKSKGMENHMLDYCGTLEPGQYTVMLGEKVGSDRERVV